MPWHVCVLIAEAGGLEPVDFPGADLSQAKSLADVPDREIRGTVGYMLTEHGDFWGRKKRITPAAVIDNLPLYRKQEADGVNGRAAAEANGPVGGFWVSDREKDRLRAAGEGGQAA